MTARTALVTGGGGGIGAAICRGLAEAGHRVAVADLAVEGARQVAADIDGVAVELGMPDGRLVVQSRPAGADVSIGGRYRGRTPLTVSVPPGNCAGST